MKHSIQLIVVLVLASIAGFHLLSKKTELPSLFEAPNFRLVDSKGEEFHSENLKGQVWAANFFFTSCPGPCAVLSSNVSKLATKFPHVKFVSITVDPKRDSNEKLEKYSKKYAANPKQWKFLRGQQEDIIELLNNGFKLGFPEDPIYHSTRIVLIDSEMQIVGFYQGTEEEGIQKIEEDLKNLADIG